MTEDSVASGFYKAYEEHTKTLRTWLVAYGAGAPVVLLANSGAANKLAGSGSGRTIAILFLVGAGLQVLLAALNKALMWACYCAAEHPERGGKIGYRLAAKVSEFILIDLAVDLASLVLFAIATWKAFDVVLRVA